MNFCGFGFALFICALSTACIMSSVCFVPQTEVGAPGLVVGVSVDGAQIWCEGSCLLINELCLVLHCGATSCQLVELVLHFLQQLFYEMGGMVKINN